MNRGVCPDCGRRYRPYEFSTDPLGRLLLDGHRCPPARPQLVQVEDDGPQYAARADGYVIEAVDRVCQRCACSFKGTTASKYCVLCGIAVKREKDRERSKRYHETRARAS